MSISIFNTSMSVVSYQYSLLQTKQHRQEKRQSHDCLTLAKQEI